MYIELENLNITNKKGKIPNLPFLSIKEKLVNKILGKKYTLNINFIRPIEAQELNTKYRNKNYIPNILSFPLSATEGEMYICLSVARKQAKDFDLSYHDYLTLLIIHGCLHLKGVDHGEEMEKLEDKYLKSFLKNMLK